MGSRGICQCTGRTTKNRVYKIELCCPLQVYAANSNKNTRLAEEAGYLGYKLDEKLDSGGIVLQRHILEEKGVNKDLRRKPLFPLGVQLILETLKMIENGKYSVTPQNESLATWELPIEQIYNAWAEVKPKTLALYAITSHIVQFLGFFFSQKNSCFFFCGFTGQFQDF